MNNKKEVVIEKKLTTVEKLVSHDSCQQLSRVVSKFLGQTINLTASVTKDRHDKERVHITSNLIDPSSMGIARFLFKTFTVGSFGYIYVDDSADETKDQHDPWFSLHCSYEHGNGGSNGHELLVGDQRINLTFDLKTSAWLISVGR